MKTSNKCKKIIYVVAIIFILMQSFVVIDNITYAQDRSDEIKGVAAKLKGQDGHGGIYEKPNPDDVEDIALKLGNYLWVAIAIGMAAGVAMIAVIGIKFILSTPEGKAEIKKQAVMYVVGALLIMSGSTFVGILADVANTVLNG